MIYLAYLRHLNLAGGNSWITSISFPQLASNGAVNVRRDDSGFTEGSFKNALNVPFIWKDPVPS